MGNALRRRTFRKSPRVLWYGALAWTVLVLCVLLLVAGFVLVFTVAFS